MSLMNGSGAGHSKKKKNKKIISLLIKGNSSIKVLSAIDYLPFYIMFFNLCGEEDEDRVHFLLECKTLEENRKTQMVKLGEALEEARGGGTRTYFRFFTLSNMLCGVPIGFC
jgi:hypothetical protein